MTYVTSNTIPIRCPQHPTAPKVMNPPRGNTTSGTTQWVCAQCGTPVAAPPEYRLGGFYYV